VVAGYGRSQANLLEAQRRGALTEVAPTLADAVNDADVVLVSVPVGALTNTLHAIAPHIKADAILMDAGSTKQDMVDAAKAVFNKPTANGFTLSQVVPAHPIAGKEKAGVAHAEATLYQDRLVILTPITDTTPAATAAAQALWQAVGARIQVMDAARHDHVFGAVSHLPHLLAFAYMNGVDPTTIAMGGTGFQDFTRIAGSDPAVWRDILHTNRDAVLAQLTQFEDALAAFKACIASGDTDTLTQLISQASAQRKAWQLPTGRTTSNDDDAA
jgi:prephenate dehydrogenase